MAKAPATGVESLEIFQKTLSVHPAVNGCPTPVPGEGEGAARKVKAR